jgi:uncharacterized protein
MKLANSFSIDRPATEVFDAFLDIERVASCMPGSRITGHPEPDTYEGEVKVKVGPLGVAYAGRFQILEADREALRLTMRAKGRELRGAGNADAYIVAQLSEQESGTLVAIDTELGIRGKVAQFGRGVIGEVTDGIMQTFARNVEDLLVTGGLAATPDGAAAPPSAAAAAPQGAPQAAPQAAPEPVAAAGDVDFDAWRLIVKPMLQRHSGSIVSLLLSAGAAYLGARLGSRPRNRTQPHP